MNFSADERLRIVRVGAPEGAGFQWEWATSLPYRCLADPQRAMVMPAAPDERANWSESQHNQRLAYYTCLQSFLTYSFGWTRHDKGLDWWRKRDFAELDDRTALIRAVWHTDDTLMGFFAWCTTVDPALAVRPLKRWARDPDRRPLSLDKETETAVMRALSRPPWTGGSDPMHLGGGDHGGAASVSSAYLGGAATEPSHGRLLGADPELRQAVFVADRVEGWYEMLCEEGADLPELPQSRNWRVDVYVREIGFVGTYRRSRATGLWFAGRHELHMAGN